MPSPKSKGKTIFKIQRPLSGDMGQALIYNEDRTIITKVPYNKQLREMFEMLGPDKFYFEGEIVNKEIVMGDIVEKQSW